MGAETATAAPNFELSFRTLFFCSCSAAYQCTKSSLLTAGGKGNEARAVAMLLTWDYCGITLTQVTEVSMRIRNSVELAFVLF